jgi:SAM-dependent methyltransferase
MRVTYRHHDGNRAYWQDRWDRVEADKGDLNPARYPGRYAEQTLSLGPPSGPILEAGCGVGRVALHYHRAGRPIVGMDFIPSAVVAVHRQAGDLPLAAADITCLPFASQTFACVLAFGLYHNLEQGLAAALAETRRVMMEGGLLCASMRLDNLQNRFTDRLAERRGGPGQPHFHKLNLTRSEMVTLFENADLEAVRFELVENMPFLYKFRPFRHRSQRLFDERSARAEGYRLSFAASLIQAVLVKVAPAQFCNLGVIIARRP